MRNIEANVKGNVLTLKVDISKEGTMSGSGKTINIATTGKPCPLPGLPEEMRVGLNVFQVVRAALHRHTVSSTDRRK